MAEIQPPTEDHGCWKRPADIMKKLHKRKKIKIKQRSFSIGGGGSSGDCDSMTGGSTSNISSQKLARNPFAKKRSLSEAVESCGKKRALSSSSNSQSFFQLHDENSMSGNETSSSESNTKELSNQDLSFVYLNEDSIQGMFSDRFTAEETTADKEEMFPEIPPDWSLKTKARFLSTSTFAWCARIKGAEEAVGLNRSYRHPLRQVDSNCQQQQSDLRVDLTRCLAYWQHPVLPGFTLFPRFGPDCRVYQHAVGEPPLPIPVRESLFDQWALAFRSVYQMLVQNICPYFYVCSQQYTALFTSSLLASQVTCLLTPTSHGFRSALQSEGIEYSMPLQQNSGKQPSSDHTSETTTSTDVTSSSVNKHHSDDECDDEDSGFTEEEEQNWQDISKNLNIQQDSAAHAAVVQDGLPRTAVLIKGTSNTQMLFNYLMDCRSSISTSGLQCGVTPTILSPTAFMGASLKKLDFRAGIAKTLDSDELKNKALTKRHKFSLDVSGPLMPHHLHSLITLLNTSQKEKEYTVAMGTHLYTMPFNHARSIDDDDVTEEHDDKIGLPRSFTRRFRPDSSKSAAISLRQIKAVNELYSFE